MSFLGFLRHLLVAETLLLVVGQSYYWTTGCYDGDYRCSSWAGRGECQRNPRYMLQYCKRSCGRCNTVNSCVDNSQYCNDWSRRGECQRNPAYMKPNCRRSCGLCAVNGNWGSWGSWTTCTRSCGGGSQRRSRTCSNPAPKNGGRTCAGSSTQSRACSNSPCVVPVHGNWGAWSPWHCTKTCGGGIKYRRRTCSNPAPRNGGRQCQGNSQQTHMASCNVQGCPVDGKWGSWGKWSVCSKTCGGGYSRKTRTCSNPAPQNGGRTCQGTNQQTESCNIQQCPEDPSVEK